MKNVTLIMAYYRNPTMLQKQADMIATWNDKVKTYWRWNVCDDGSPPELAARLANPPIPTEIYRILVDVRWNQDAARNIAVANAKTPWILMTDMDHMVPPETAHSVAWHKHDPARVYRFSRVSAPDLSPYKPHPNSWLMTREMFYKIGCYDERFAGYYGSDAEFRDRVVATAGAVIDLPEALIRVPREVTPDASTTFYKRKQPEDQDGVRRIKQAIKENPGPVTLSFPWEIVQ